MKENTFSLDIHQKKFDKILKKNEIKILFFTLIFGFLIRILYLDYSSMWIDETISATASKAIIETGRPIFESGVLYSRASVFHYLMAFSLLFSKSDFAARSISVIFGVLTIYLAYLFSKKFINTGFSNVFFPFLIAILSLEIIYSKQARFYQMLQFFYFLTIYLFYLILDSNKIDKKTIIYSILFIFSLIIAIDTHPFSYILFPIFVLATLIYKFNLKEIFKKKIFYFLFILSIISIVYILIKFNNLIYLDELGRAIIYSQLYYSFYLSWIPILIISMIGIIISIKDNSKIFLGLNLFLLIPLGGMFFIKFFATRYIYFSIFLIIFNLVYILNKLHFKYIILVIILVFFSSTMFSFVPIKEPRYDFTMPISNYKIAYEFLNNNSNNFSNYETITTWTPAAIWYSNNTDYWINYSLSGTNSNWQIKDNREIYSNASIIYSTKDFPDQAIIILDNQGKRKLKPKLNEFIFNNSQIIFKNYNIEILKFNKINSN